MLRNNDPPDFRLNDTKDLLDLYAEKVPFAPDQSNDLEFWKQSVH
jgi:hypothetical protein